MISLPSIALIRQNRNDAKTVIDNSTPSFPVLYPVDMILMSLDDSDSLVVLDRGNRQTRTSPEQDTGRKDSSCKNC